MSAVAHRTVEFDNAALLSLKVFAFLLMILDHVDWLFSSGHGVHAGIGRLVFPIFGVILAFNLARIEPSKILRVVAPRLVLAGAVAQVPYFFLQGHMFPLNILFTLGLASFSYATARSGGWPVAIISVLAGSVVVDYAWFGVVGVVLCAGAFRTAHEGLIVASWFVFAAMLTAINGNVAALLAVPLLWIVSQVVQGDAPRWKWLFLAGYPLHLAMLALVKFA